MDGLGIAWLGLALTLVLLAAALFLWARERLARSGLPAGQVLYSDHGAWFRQEKPLYSAEFRLVGKPDYLVKARDGAIIPVEVKSGRAPHEPREGHVLQLAAYCLLVEELYGRRPEYGILQYRDRAFALEYGPELEDDLLSLLEEMREADGLGELSRDHDDPRRCAACGLREVCAERLA
ncbi:MAG: CRISPR-associated protein Cas4 [Candidatus Promineifilaceae bacterium]